MSITKHLNEIQSIITSEQESRAHRYTLFPIEDEQSYKFFKKQEASIWSSNEMNFRQDKKDFETLPKEQRDMLLTIFAFFAPADGLISMNLIRFLLECKTYEEQLFFIAQMNIEAVHAETYSLTIHTLIPSESERKELFEAVDNLPCVKLKADWMEKYMCSDVSKAERFCAFACAEGIFFMTLFAPIFWFRSKGILNMVVFSNEQISKDESLHKDYGVYMVRKYGIGTEEEREKLKEIVLSAVEVEKKFCKVLLPKPIEDLSYEGICQYIEVIADNLLVQLGLSKYFGSKNPYSFLDDICLEQKNNFYDTKVGSYKQMSLKDATDWKARAGLVEEVADSYENPEDIDF